MRVWEPSLTDPGALGAGVPFPGAFRAVRLHVEIATSPRRPRIAPEFPGAGEDLAPLRCRPSLGSIRAIRPFMSGVTEFDRSCAERPEAAR